MSSLWSLFPLFFVVLTMAAGQIAPTPPKPTTLRRPSCGKTCNFVICGFRRAILSNPKLPITRPICFHGVNRIGQILSVDEARVTPRGQDRGIPISRLPFNDKQPYKSDFFFPMRSDIALPNVSAMGVRFMPRPALENLQSACVRIPVTRWIEDGEERTGRGCVAFTIQVPKIMVELTWDSNDDLDLFVVEPDGANVFFESKNSSGRLLRDAGRKSCGRRRRVGGKETIVYYANEIVKKGTYFVMVEHTKNCQESETSWELRVVVKGRLLRHVRGVSNLTEGGMIPKSAVSFVVYD